jgi:hypothetical protein
LENVRASCSCACDNDTGHCAEIYLLLAYLENIRKRQMVLESEYVNKSTYKRGKSVEKYHLRSGVIIYFAVQINA